VIMSTAAPLPGDTMAWYRTTMLRARMLVVQRWMPDYVDVDHLAVVLLDPPATDLAKMLKRFDVDPVALRASLVEACDAWVQGLGLELGFGYETVGGGAPTPRLQETLRLLCPDGDGCGRCVFSATDLFVALTRVRNSFLRQALGEGVAEVLAALPIRELCARARA
jgi:hypothetical protein